MKFGIKMHKGSLRNGENKLIRSHAKINIKSHFGRGDFCFRSLCLLVKKKMSSFAFRITVVK